MLDEASALTADVLRLTLGLGLLILAYNIGQRVSDRTGRIWPGWAAGLIVFFGVGLVIQPARQALRVVSCQTVAEAAACIDGDLAIE